MNVDDCGALGNGKDNDAPSIQRAIDACYNNGGGKVVLSAGKTYYSSSIQLKENIELHLEKGSVLKAHSDINTYISPDNKGCTPVIGESTFAFIYALNADHISITGQGTIDGNARSFVKRVNPYYVTGNFYPRPTMVYTENCNHARFMDVSMVNAPFWTLHPAGSDDVLISQLYIGSDLDIANCDGIDPDHCTNVRIIGCHISCADDCICIKNTYANRKYAPSRNIIVSNCTLRSTSAAIKIGTEGVNDFENLLVDNCVIYESNRGLSIQIRDEGHVRNISFSNIIIETRRFNENWWGCGEPIVLTTHNRNEETESGRIENVRFFNITCDSENGVLLSGSHDKKIRDISFNRISLNLHKKSKWPIGMYDLRPIHNAEEFIGKASPGFYILNSKEIVVEKSKVAFAGEDLKGFSHVVLVQGSEDICLDVIGHSAHSHLRPVEHEL